jgi:hypothetical protein
MKRCVKCGVEQPLENFYQAAGTRDGLRGDCKGCFKSRAAARYRADPAAAKARVKRWQQENAERLNEYRRQRREDPAVKRRERDTRLKRVYGIGVDDYDRMLEAQAGGCAICGRPPREDISFHVDHDPASGSVRALLCFKCNNLLGDVGDDPWLLRAAAMYLDGHVDELARQRARSLALSSPGR